MITFVQTEIDSTLCGSCYTKSEIETTLNPYSPTAQILSIFTANYTLIIPLYQQPKQEHFITIQVKLTIWYYLEVLAPMLIIPFTLKLKMIFFSRQIN